jgi:hypothetical protein
MAGKQTSRTERALEQVRGLLVPMIQLNVGRNQIISQSAEPGSSDM